VQIDRQAAILFYVPIDDIVSFCKAQHVAMALAAGQFNHFFKIQVVRNISGYMKPEIPIEHQRRLDFAPILLWVILQNGKVILIRTSHRGAKTFNLMGITDRSAVASSASDDRRERHAWNTSHLGISFADRYWYSIASFGQHRLNLNHTACLLCLMWPIQFSRIRGQSDMVIKRSFPDTYLLRCCA